MNPWELIFRQSRVNRGGYYADQLPAHIWDWPRGTWFQTRLRHLRTGRGEYTRALPHERWQ